MSIYCREKNAAVILITHSAGQAYRIADEILFFSSGLLIERGNAKELIDKPETKEVKLFISL